MAKDPSEEYWAAQNKLWRRGRSSGELGYMTASGYVLKGSKEDQQRKEKDLKMATQYETRELSGSLFRNDKKEEGSNQPDYRGELRINGILYWQSAWLKTSPSGKKYMSFAYQVKEAQPTAVEPTPAPAPAPADDTPF